MKLIDADALLVALRDYWAEGTNETGMEVLDKIIVSLENKGADAEPVKYGKWILDRLASTSGGTYGVRRCSRCEAYYQGDSFGWNYCPHCGAKMEAKDEDY